MEVSDVTDFTKLGLCLQMTLRSRAENPLEDRRPL